MPQRCEVDGAAQPWHPEEHDLTAGRHDRQRLRERVVRCDAVDDRADPVVSWSPTTIAPVRTRTVRLSSFRRDDLGWPQRAGELALRRVLGGNEDGSVVPHRAQRGDREQPERAGAITTAAGESTGRDDRAGGVYAQAVGSMRTASSSVNASGTVTSCDSWAVNAIDQPPPVVSQKPVWSPGSRWPNAIPRTDSDARPRTERHTGVDASHDTGENRNDDRPRAVVEAPTTS